MQKRRKCVGELTTIFYDLLYHDIEFRVLQNVVTIGFSVPGYTEAEGSPHAGKISVRKVSV